MRTITKILIADAVLLIAEFLVLQDLGWRVAYATAKGLTPTFSYSPLIQVFTLGGGSFPLRSPPTLDWVQLILVILVVLNGGYFARLIARKRKKRPTPEAVQGKTHLPGELS